MKTVLLSAIVAAVVAYGVGAAGSSRGGVEPTRQESAYERVERTKTLRCGYAIWEPRIGYDTAMKKPNGFFADVVEEIGRYAKIKIEWVAEVDWGQVPTALKTKKIDAMCAGVWESADEGKFVNFIKPPVYEAIVAVVRDGDMRFENSPAVLNHADIKLAVIEGDNSDAIAQADFPLSPRVAVPQLGNNTDIIMNVATGKADAALVDASSAAEFIAQNPGKVRIVSGVYPRVFGATISVDIAEHELAALLNNAVNELVNAGVVEKILARYPGYASASFAPKKPF